MRKNIVIAQRLYYSKHGRVFVQNGNLAVSEKEIFVLIGPQGSGKTSLFQLLRGCLRPEKGMLVLFGNPMPSFKEYRRVGMVQAEKGFYENMSGRANIKMKALAFGNYKRELLWEAVRITEMEDIVRKRVRSYTQEQKIRLGIAMAIVGSPKMLLLDEALDHVSQKERGNLVKLIKLLNRKYGLTILISSSNPQTAQIIGTSYGIMKKGTLLMRPAQGKAVSEKRDGKKAEKRRGKYD
ncbi:MAG: ATP-binding cassette domain-containing protein [Clostridiales bacterium]|nr:ATP-binding cassette domain-containing protein [Clostridiales bacterium]